MAIVVEVPRSIWTCPRVRAVEAFCDWLWAHHRRTLGLPSAEVVVEVRAGRRVGSTTAVGRIVVEDTIGTYPDAFLVQVAIGTDDDQDAHDWASRLATVSHELVHVGQFAKMFGGVTPGAIARRVGGPHSAIETALRPWLTTDNEGAGARSPEAIGARLRDEFLTAHREFAACPVCPSRCGCRSR